MQSDELITLAASLSRDEAAALLPLIVAKLTAPVVVVPAPASNGDGDLLTAQAVATKLGVSKRFVYDHATALGAVRLSESTVRFPVAALDEFVRRRGRH